jgi:hypothetical protein
MSNHAHLWASSKILDLSGTVRDFKKFTSKKIIETIINNEHESRKECLPAGRQGCSKFLKLRERKIAEIQTTPA